MKRFAPIILSALIAATPFLAHAAVNTSPLKAAIQAQLNAQFKSVCDQLALTQLLSFIHPSFCGPSTPPVTQTPTVSLSANPQTVNAGATTTLSWQSTNANSCTASNGWNGSKALNGSEVVTVPATTTYALSCSGTGGTATSSVVVAARQAPGNGQTGTMTVTNASSVASQNISVNVSNQVLGGFVTNIANEPVTLQQMTFNIATTSTGPGALTLISIVDENGAVIAGPVDSNANGTFTFSNSVTFPQGQHTYTIKGKVPSGFQNGGTIRISTTPGTQWLNVQGANTGQTISLTGSGTVTMNLMTVRAGVLSITASSNPASQNVVAGAQDQVLANFFLDATQSGEDVRISSFKFRENGTGDTSKLSGCQLWDGTTALNTGSNVLNTMVPGANTMTLDNSLTTTKGTTKTIALSCNVSSTATSGATYQFGVNSTDSYSVVGVQSGTAITPNVTTSNSGIMTMASGASVSATIDPSSPSYQVAAGGTTGITLGVIRFRSTNESLNLTKLGLTARNGMYGAFSTGQGGQASGAGDITTVYLYSGATLLGTATFLGNSNYATSTFSSPFTVPHDTDTLITVKADLANIGVSGSGGIGNLIKVDPSGFEGTGVSSGQTVIGGANGGSAGVRLFKSFPTLALDTLPSTGVADGRLMRFKITSNAAGSVGVSQFKFSIATTSAIVSNAQLFIFTDSSYSSPIAGQGAGGQIGSTVSGISNSPFTIRPASNPVEIPAGQTYFAELRGAVSSVIAGSSVVVTLRGDSAYPTAIPDGYNVGTSSAIASGNSFIWSGNSTSTSQTSDIDWSNGYGIMGLPTSGMIQTRSN